MEKKEYIEREALREKLDYELARWIDSAHDYKDDTSGMLAMKEAIYDVITAPAADVQEVRHGNWILLRESEITGFNPEFGGRDPIGGYQCSNCKEEAIFDCNDEFVLSRYCPYCGAKMGGKDPK